MWLARKRYARVATCSLAVTLSYVPVEFPMTSVFEGIIVSYVYRVSLLTDRDRDEDYASGRERHWDREAVRRGGMIF